MKVILNPVELLWSQLKRSLANQFFTGLEQLQEAILEEVAKLQTERKQITAFFHKKEVAYFTN
jgi:transposase